MAETVRRRVIPSRTSVRRNTKRKTLSRRSVLPPKDSTDVILNGKKLSEKDLEDIEKSEKIVTRSKRKSLIDTVKEEAQEEGQQVLTSGLQKEKKKAEPVEGVEKTDNPEKDRLEEAKEREEVEKEAKVEEKKEAKIEEKEREEVEKEAKVEGKKEAKIEGKEREEVEKEAKAEGKEREEVEKEAKIEEKEREEVEKEAKAEKVEETDLPGDKEEEKEDKEEEKVTRRIINPRRSLRENIVRKEDVKKNEPIKEGVKGIRKNGPVKEVAKGIRKTKESSPVTTNTAKLKRKTVLDSPSPSVPKARSNMPQIRPSIPLTDQNSQTITSKDLVKIDGKKYKVTKVRTYRKRKIYRGRKIPDFSNLTKEERIAQKLYNQQKLKLYAQKMGCSVDEIEIDQGDLESVCKFFWACDDKIAIFKDAENLMKKTQMIWSFMGFATNFISPESKLDSHFARMSKKVRESRQDYILCAEERQKARTRPSTASERLQNDFMTQIGMVVGVVVINKVASGPMAGVVTELFQRFIKIASSASLDLEKNISPDDIPVPNNNRKSKKKRSPPVRPPPNR